MAIKNLLLVKGFAPWGPIRVIYICSFALIGFLLAAFQPFGFSPDYIYYDKFFDLVRGNRFEDLLDYRFEPLFSIIAYLLTLLVNSNLLVYSLIVVLLMLFKSCIFLSASSGGTALLGIYVYYLFRYLPLHELTQIRVAGAVALVLLGANLVWSGKKYLGGVLLLAAGAFHMSSLILMPGVYIKPRNRKFIVFISIITFVIATVLQATIVDGMSQIISVVNSYQNDGFTKVSSFYSAPDIFLDILLILYSLVFWNQLSLRMQRVVFLEILGLAVFLATLSIDVVAHRIRELFSVFWVFYIIDGLALKATKLPIFLFVVVGCVFYFYLYVGRGKFFYGG